MGGGEGIFISQLQHVFLQVLQSGEEVKLQRNALQVIQFPTGNEEYSSSEEEEQQPLERVVHPLGYPQHFSPNIRPALATTHTLGTLYSNNTPRAREQTHTKRPRYIEEPESRRSSLRQTTTMVSILLSNDKFTQLLSMWVGQQHQGYVSSFRNFLFTHCILLCLSLK